MPGVSHGVRRDMPGVSHEARRDTPRALRITSALMSDALRTGSLNVLCLGEALVDMICERHVESLDDADMFVPHFGGAVANVALMAARAGAAKVTIRGGSGCAASSTGPALSWSTSR
jgi:hypothetical protein